MPGSAPPGPAGHCGRAPLAAPGSCPATAGGLPSWFIFLSSSIFCRTRSFADSRWSPTIRTLCGPPGAAGGRTEMYTAPPALARISLMVAPPGPMRGPTSSGGTWTSLGSAWSGKARAARGTLRAGVPIGRAARGPGLGTPSGQPLVAKASLIICSVFSTSPTMVTVPSGSWGKWSILMSAPLRLRMSRIVSPPLPMSARICTPSIFMTLKFSGATPGGGLGFWSPLGTRSCSQSGTSFAALPSSSSHFVLRRRLLSSAGAAP
mmetsp:Transcript_770/g.2491  ORF Transcript_770/g.2491 Transcript_770/m.2491 type:complete len:263 (-) Transcript_770:326-1114(-)